MAKPWYPVIDYLVCSECSTCVSFCSHSVYDQTKAPSPVVVQPQSCIDHCHGCGNQCPVGAITYVGDDTGWVPPHGEKAEDKTAPCCCGGLGSNERAVKAVLIQYLYLDLTTCDRCIGADTVLKDVLHSVVPALEAAGYTVQLQKVEISNEQIAQQYCFFASPTIRVNGQDICGQVQENTCGCCGEISGTDVTCRTFAYEGKTHDVPPKAMLAEGLLKAVFGLEQVTCNCSEYTLPENLKNFFEGKAAKSRCCGGNCQ